ncbi:MAG TPA: hypothetical protein VN715_01275 [Roseiarcus sp.]|nr:hypothetical protein [Roseiarcus sp.]
MTDEIITVGRAIPRIAKAVPLDGRLVEITWKNGGSKMVDLTAPFASRRVFIPLRDDDALFRTLRISEYGDALEWDGPDLEFPASWLDKLPDVNFSNEDFRKAMDTLHVSLDGMAADLDLSRSLIAEYRKDKRIPRHVALATRYLLELTTDPLRAAMEPAVKAPRKRA